MAAFVLPLAIHSPESESLHDVTRPSLAQKLRSRFGTLLLGTLLIALAAITFGANQLSIDPKLAALFGLSRYGVFERGWVFQLVTGNLIHINLFHLIANLSVLMLLSAYEWRVGIRRYMGVFLIAAIMSSVIDLFLMNENTVSMGASAGICGLAAAYFVDHRDTSRKEWVIGILSVLALVGVYSFLGNVDAGKAGYTVNWIAHVSGALVGGSYVRVFQGRQHRAPSGISQSEGQQT
jgi:membrane associated rhomboid family serine protease